MEPEMNPGQSTALWSAASSRRFRQATCRRQPEGRVQPTRAAGRRSAWPTRRPSSASGDKSLSLPASPGRNSANPNGIPAQSPELRGTSYPGLARPGGSNPNGVAARWVTRGRTWAQPRWGWRPVGDPSQGSSPTRNPGLEDAIPLGLAEAATERGCVRSTSRSRPVLASGAEILLRLFRATPLRLVLWTQPRSLQDSCPNALFGAGCLDLLWCLVLGAWSFIR